MVEYIEREALLSFIDAATDNSGMGYVVARTLKRFVKRQPAADVAPVRHGRWAYCDTYMDGITMFTCSCCGDKQNGRNGWSWKKNFCPNCGAKMDVEDNHDSN